MFQRLQNLLASSRRRRTSRPQIVSGPAAVATLEARRMMSADIVTRWNNVMLDAVRVVKPAPPVGSRAMAIVSLAVFDALNSIEGKYAPYLTKVSTSLATSQAMMAR